MVEGLLATSEGECFTRFQKPQFTQTARLMERDGRHVTHKFNNWCPLDGQSPMAKWNNTLYILPYNMNFMLQTDDGKTWNLVYSWSERKVFGSVSD